MRCTRGERRFLLALVFLDFAVDLDAEDFEVVDLLDLVVELFLVLVDPCDEDDCVVAGAASEPDWCATAAGNESAATHPTIRMTKSVKGRENNCKLTISNLL
jgi:hypothetical protein